ncbi:glycosyltransferase family 2 protein [Methylorubrum aminovorans]
MRNHQASQILLWDEDRGPIREQIAERRAPFKLLMKTKNEPEFLAEWIEHHARIVGRENLIIADNGSTDPAMLAALTEAAKGSVVFRFSGFHKFIHDRTIFPDLYAALKHSCDHYMFMDSDERLLWTDGETWIADNRILERVAARQSFSILPGIMLDNFAMERDIFHFTGTEPQIRELVLWGKPIVSTAADVGGPDVLHVCQFPASFTAIESPINVVSLHLSRLNPEQRLKANRSKLVIRGRVAEETSFEEIAAIPDQAIQNDGVVLRLVKEIRDILGAIDPKSGRSWGPTDKAFSIKINPDGTIGFPNGWIRESFNSFVSLGAAYLPNKNRFFVTRG